LKIVSYRKNKMSENKEIPKISIESDVKKDPKWNDYETSSIGSSADLVGDDDDIKIENRNSRTGTLGWNLPTNDLLKAGNLDTLSVDSYWIGEEEIEEIEKEKIIDPVNPNYKAVYEKMKNKVNISSQKDSEKDDTKSFKTQKTNLPDQTH
jgi:hypothetical protein